MAQLGDCGLKDGSAEDEQLCVTCFVYYIIVVVVVIIIIISIIIFPSSFVL